MNFFYRLFGHWNTVRKHRREVRRLCFKCGLYWQGLTHDLSKYSPVEFFNGVRYYSGKQSPHVAERKENGYSVAWLHHKAHNKHHCDYWLDNITGETESVEMPRKYLIEMVCDRIAASKCYLGKSYTEQAPRDYYLSHFNEGRIHATSRYYLHLFLFELAANGEEGMLQLIQSYLKNN